MKKVSSANDPTPKKSQGRSLWLWVIAGFVFLATLWTALFWAANSVHIETVPLPTQPAKP